MLCLRRILKGAIKREKAGGFFEKKRLSRGKGGGKKRMGGYHVRPTRRTKISALSTIVEQRIWAERV